jgi:hypothetical protein
VFSSVRKQKNEYRMAPVLAFRIDMVAAIFFCMVHCGNQYLWGIDFTVGPGTGHGMEWQDARL